MTCGAGYAFALLIAVDTLLWSTRLCRPEVLSLCWSLLIYGCTSCIFAWLGERHRLLCQMCLLFADRG